MKARLMRRCTRGVSMRATALVLLASLIAGLVAACASTSGPTGLLEGTVTLGPITPVEQVGGPPNTRPYAATIDIKTAAGDVVETVTSGNDGTFAVRLEAGSYRLVPRSPKDLPLPYAAPQDVIIAAGKTTTVKIAYDSGVR